MAKKTKKFSNAELRGKITRAKNRFTNVALDCAPNCKSGMAMPCDCGGDARRAEIKAVIAELSLE